MSRCEIGFVIPDGGSEPKEQNGIAVRSIKKIDLLEISLVPNIENENG